ncbi:P-loop NTPase fold protein [Phormidesmis sp. 146-35]
MEKSLLETFRKAYRDLELFPLLTAEQIAAFRVEYGSETIAKLEQAIEDAPTNGKLVFAGHRGCGKSTLLAKSSNKMMRQGYFVVFFSIADLVEMSAVDHVNILYSVALSMMSEATKRQIPISEGIKQDLLHWFSTTQTQVSSQDIKTEMGVGGEFFKVLTARLKNEKTFREEIKTTFEKSISELARKADLIATAIQTATKKEVLVVIDDLDKLDFNLVKEIYKNNINALFLPKFRIIYTIPISAIRDNEVLAELQTAMSTRIRQFEVCKFYRFEEVRDPAAIPKEKSVNLFLEVLHRRLPRELVEPEIAIQMVLKSGVLCANWCALRESVALNVCC